MTGHRTWRHAAAWACALLFVTIPASAAIPEAPKLLMLQGEEVIASTSDACGLQPRAALPAAPASVMQPALPASPLRVLSWNVHKGGDRGWQTDLARYAASHDVLMLQEAVLTPEMRAVLEAAGMRWQMAGAFSFKGVERGVLLAARVSPVSICTYRTWEPLTVLPKTTLVARYRIQGSSQLLAVANLHGVNFTLGLGAFTEQLEAVATELSGHDGPIVLGGDLNTWSASRLARLDDLAKRLRLQTLALDTDHRRVAFGKPLDHILVRGLQPRSATTEAVRSSDHNPILVQFDLR